MHLSNVSSFFRQNLLQIHAYQTILVSMVEPAAVALDLLVLHAVVLQDTLAMTVAQMV